MEPLISVIIPAYNVSEFLPRCLDSLLAQTWQRLELLVVDDGSADGTAAVAEGYARRDSRVRVLRKENGGVSSARNLGLEAARGELIGFTDGDDWVKPDYLAKLAAALLENDADMAACGYIEELPVPGAQPLLHGTGPQPVCGPKEAAFLFLQREGFFTALWNKLFRRECLRTQDGLLRFDETLAIGEDETWLLRLLPGLRRVAFCPEPLYCWTMRPDSASRRETVSARALTVLSAKRQAIALAAPFGEELTALTRSRFLNDCYHLKVFAYRAHDRALMKRLRREFREMRPSWLRSGDVPPLRKAKVLCMELLMLLHAPSAWVDRCFYMRRRGVAAH